MFESKKWLVVFFALALVGSIGGSLVAYLILNKKPAPQAQAPVTPVVPEAKAPAAPPVTNLPPRAVAETKVTNVPPPVAAVIDDIKPDFAIVSRAEWGAKAPTMEMKPHVPVAITIHHTATPQAPEKSLASKLKGLQNFSQREDTLFGGKKKPAWPDLPYHYYIDVNGVVGECRDINYVGDTNTDYDTTGQILITLEGNFEKGEPSDKQMQMLFKMVAWLSKKYKVSGSKISGHKDHALTACPGKNLENRLEEIRRFALN